MAPEADYYQVLGLGQTATPADIRKAYYRLAKIHHPDKKAPGRTIDAVEFRQVHDAYELLIDPPKRVKYDKRYSNVYYQGATSQPSPAHRERAANAEQARKRAQEDQYRRWKERADVDDIVRKRKAARRAEEKERKKREAEIDAERMADLKRRRAAAAERVRMQAEERWAEVKKQGRLAREKLERENAERLRRAQELDEELCRDAARRARERQDEAVKQKLHGHRMEEYEARDWKAALEVEALNALGAQTRHRKGCMAEDTAEQLNGLREDNQEPADRYCWHAAVRRWWGTGVEPDDVEPLFFSLSDCDFCELRRQWLFKCPDCGLVACLSCAEAKFDL